MKFKQVLVFVVSVCATCLFILGYFRNGHTQFTKDYQIINRGTGNETTVDSVKTGTEYDIMINRRTEKETIDSVKTGTEYDIMIDRRTEKETIDSGKTEAEYDIILNAYKHSGSTATGRILSKRTDTFYVHEPLWQVATSSFYKGSSKICSDLDGCMNASSLSSKTTSNVEDVENSFQENDEWVNHHQPLNKSSAFLQSILDCDFHRFSKFFFDPEIPTSQVDTVQTIFYHGYGWNEFKECRTKKEFSLTQCLSLAEETCKSAKHRVIKLLRMTLDNLAPLLKANPRLKVIHLFRDPRGIFNSYSVRRSINLNNTERVRVAVKTICERFFIDLQASKMLQSDYPDRVKIIQYERFFDAPLTDAASDLYKFAGMEYGSVQKKIIQKKFNRNESKTAGFHPFTYRTKLPWSVVQLFNKDCSEVLDGLGYTRYNEEEHLQDLSRSGLS